MFSEGRGALVGIEPLEVSPVCFCQQPTHHPTPSLHHPAATSATIHLARRPQGWLALALHLSPTKPSDEPSSERYMGWGVMWRSFLLCIHTYADYHTCQLVFMMRPKHKQKNEVHMNKDGIAQGLQHNILCIEYKLSSKITVRLYFGM